MKTYALDKKTGELVEIEREELGDEYEESPFWMYQQSLVRARRVYYKNSRSQAIRAHCIECSGSATEARKCVVHNCPLWTFRPGAERGKKPGGVPSLSVLERGIEQGVKKVPSRTVPKTEPPKEGNPPSEKPKIAKRPLSALKKRSVKKTDSTAKKRK